MGAITQTDFGYTGQRDLDAQGNANSLGLMDYNARFYDAALGRFISPDSITPGGPQGLNRYSYVNNNPVNTTDPTGHRQTCSQFDEDRPDCYRPSDTGYKPTPLVIADNYRYQADCAAGRNPACPGGAAGAVIFLTGTVFTAGVGSELVLGGTAADAVSAVGTAAINAAYAAVVKTIAGLATHNPDSSTVSIGSNDLYQMVGKMKTYTYFDLPEWFFNTFPGITNDANGEFMANQIAQLKNFVVTYPLNIPGLGTQAEMDWIEASGMYSRATITISPFLSLFYLAH